MIIDGQYLHTLDPFAIDFGGGYGIRWYGLAYLAGFVAGYLLIRWMLGRTDSPLKKELVSDFVFTVAAATIIGGRLGYCIFYSPDLLFRFTAEAPFWGALAIHEGGMASHGGILGVIAGSLIFARQHKLPFLHLADLTTFGGSIGIFFGRIANFINGELPGRICPDGYQYAVRFPQDILAWPGHASEKLFSLTPAVTALGYDQTTYQRLLQSYSTSSTQWKSLNEILHQIIAQAQNGNEAVARALLVSVEPRYPSQLIAAVLEGLLVFLVLAWVWRKPRKPGVVGGVFLVTYSAVRIVSETFRLPDMHIGYQLLGLTRGQWLSLGLLGASLIILFVCIKRDTPTLLGWMSRPEP